MKYILIMSSLLIFLCENTVAQMVVEKEYIPYLNAAEIERDRQNYAEPAWMDVLVRGKMTLYLRIVNQIYSRGRSMTYYYYCRKENEKAASEISYTNYNDGSQLFRNYTHQFFSDHPTISEKIKNSEIGYAARFIEDIVKEYNRE